MIFNHPVLGFLAAFGVTSLLCFQSIDKCTSENEGQACVDSLNTALTGFLNHLCVSLRQRSRGFSRLNLVDGRTYSDNMTSVHTPDTPALTTVDKPEEPKSKKKAATKSPSRLTGQRKKRKRPSSGKADSPPQPVAAINKLPLELRLQIIQYVTNDAFTILNLLLVSKIWYTTLTSGKLAERMWKDRCLYMGMKKKAPLCRTWYTTYLDALHKRCACCFRMSNNRIGSLMISGYKWMRACQSYRDRPGPLHVQLISTAAIQYGVTLEDLITMPACFESSRGEAKTLELDETDPRIRYSLLYVLETSVAQMKLMLEAKKLETIETSPVDKRLLAHAINHSRAILFPPSRALNEAVATLHLHDSPTTRHYEDVIHLYQAIESTLNEVEAVTVSGGMDADVAVRLLLSTRRSQWTWLDSMILGKMSMSTFLAALRAENFKVKDVNRQYEYKFGPEWAFRDGRRILGRILEKTSSEEDDDDDFKAIQAGIWPMPFRMRMGR